MPAATAYYLYYTSAFVPTDGWPWRLLPLVLWGVYMALVATEMAYMELFLPRMHMAARDALADVGWTFFYASHLGTAVVSARVQTHANPTHAHHTHTTRTQTNLQLYSDH